MLKTEKVSKGKRILKYYFFTPLGEISLCKKLRTAKLSLKRCFRSPNFPGFDMRLTDEYVLYIVKDIAYRGIVEEDLEMN
ncbi:MAG: hypothetical protein AAF519_13930 [Bacteroidota bacterium]